MLESNALDSVSFKKLQDYDEDEDNDEDESLRTDTNVQIKEENILEEENSFYRLLYTNDTDLSIKKDAPYQFEKLRYMRFDTITTHLNHCITTILQYCFWLQRRTERNFVLFCNG